MLLRRFSSGPCADEEHPRPDPVRDALHQLRRTLHHRLNLGPIYPGDTAALAALAPYEPVATTTTALLERQPVPSAVASLYRTAMRDACAMGLGQVTWEQVADRSLLAALATAPERPLGPAKCERDICACGLLPVEPAPGYRMRSSLLDELVTLREAVATTLHLEHNDQETVLRAIDAVTELPKELRPLVRQTEYQALQKAPTLTIAELDQGVIALMAAFRLGDRSGARAAARAR